MSTFSEDTLKLSNSYYECNTLLEADIHAFYLKIIICGWIILFFYVLFSKNSAASRISQSIFEGSGVSKRAILIIHNTLLIISLSLTFRFLIPILQRSKLFCLFHTFSFIIAIATFLGSIAVLFVPTVQWNASEIELQTGHISRKWYDKPVIPAFELLSAIPTIFLLAMAFFLRNSNDSLLFWLTLSFPFVSAFNSAVMVALFRRAGTTPSNLGDILSFALLVIASSLSGIEYTAFFHFSSAFAVVVILCLFALFCSLYCSRVLWLKILNRKVAEERNKNE